MLKKYTSYLGVFVLICFSFFYTDRAVDIVKRNDPIMKNILSNKDNLEVDAVSAYIDSDEMIPGINGLAIDINKSYSNMKKYDKYDETMLIFNEIAPSVSLNNNYDKYIVSGNKEKKHVALIFKVNDMTDVDKINDILLEKNIVATFFIDGEIINNNLDVVSELVKNKYEIENLGYDGNYEISKLLWTNNLISSITHKDPKYCYTDYKNSEVLDLCKKNNMYTIIPNISVSNYPFITIKQSLTNGSIISFNINSDTIKELPSIISYIKQKGYNLVILDDLVSEKIIEE